MLGELRRNRVAPAAALAALLAGCAHHRDTLPVLTDNPADTPPPKPRHHAHRLTINSPIAAIAADPRGKAVLEKDLPGLCERPEYDMFKHMSLKTIQPMSKGQLTDADLAKVAADLERLNGPR